MNFRLEQIPGFAEEFEEAKAKEREFRELAFFGLPLLVAGIEIRVMTLRDHAVLACAGSPFVVGGSVTLADVGVFLWALSPEFTEDREAREAFMARIAALDFEKAVEAIRDYRTMLFVDAPKGGSGGTPATAFIASVTHRLASAYGWSRNSIHDLPLPEVFQYLKRLSGDDGAIMFNPFSDKVKGDYLRKLREATPEQLAAWGGSN